MSQLVTLPSRDALAYTERQRRARRGSNPQVTNKTVASVRKELEGNKEIPNKTGGCTEALRYVCICWDFVGVAGPDNRPHDVLKCRPDVVARRVLKCFANALVPRRINDQKFRQT